MLRTEREPGASKCTKRIAISCRKGEGHRAGRVNKKKEEDFPCDKCGGVWKASEWIMCDLCDTWWCKGCTKMTKGSLNRAAGTEEEFFCNIYVDTKVTCYILSC